MSLFYQDIKAVEGRAGQDAYDPCLLICLWIYAYSEGVSAAREVGRRCEYHPAYQWLTGMKSVNYHSLSTFRVQYKEALDGLFAQVLAVMQSQGLVELQRVTQDGTKIQAAASRRSLPVSNPMLSHLRQAPAGATDCAQPE